MPLTEEQKKAAERYLKEGTEPVEGGLTRQQIQAANQMLFQGPPAPPEMVAQPVAPQPTVPQIPQEFGYLNTPEGQAFVQKALTQPESLTPEEQQQWTATVNAVPELQQLQQQYQAQAEQAKAEPQAGPEWLTDSEQRILGRFAEARKIFGGIPHTGGIPYVKLGADVVAEMFSPAVEEMEKMSANIPWPISPHKDRSTLTNSEIAQDRRWQKLNKAEKAAYLGQKVSVGAVKGALGFVTQQADILINPEKYNMTPQEAVNETADGLADMMANAPDQVGYIAEVMFGTPNNPITKLADAAGTIANLPKIAAGEKRAMIREEAINTLYEAPESLPFALMIGRGAWKAMKEKIPIRVGEKAKAAKLPEGFKVAEEVSKKAAEKPKIEKPGEPVPKEGAPEAKGAEKIQLEPTEVKPPEVPKEVFTEGVTDLRKGLEQELAAKEEYIRILREDLEEGYQSVGVRREVKRDIKDAEIEAEGVRQQIKDLKAKEIPEVAAKEAKPEVPEVIATKHEMADAARNLAHTKRFIKDTEEFLKRDDIPDTLRKDQEIRLKQARLDEAKYRAQVAELSKAAEKAAPKEETPTEKHVGISKAEIERVRKAFPDFEKLPEAEQQSMVESLTKAREAGTDKAALDIVEQAAAEKRPFTVEEVGGLVVKHAELLNEVGKSQKTVSELVARGDIVGAAAEASRKNALLEQIDRLHKGIKPGKTEMGRAFQLLQGLIDQETMDIGSVLRRAQEAKGTGLTTESHAKFEKLTEKYTEAKSELDRVTADYDKLLAEQERLRAEQVAGSYLKKQRIEKASKAAKGRILKEREHILSQLKALGFRMNDITGVTAEGAYWVGRLAVNYIKEGAVTLKEVVAKVRADLPRLSERDVWKALNTRDPKQIAKVQSETTKRVKFLKNEARLLDEIKDAEDNIFKPTKKRAKPADDIKALQKKLSDLRREAYKKGNEDLQGGLLERTIERINAAQAMLENQYRAIKRKQTVPTEQLTEARKILGDIRKEMRVEDRIADLEEQLRTGEYKQSVPIPEVEEPLPIQKARIKEARLKKDIRQAIEDERPWGIRRIALEAEHTLRAMRASGDISFTFRQNVVPSLAFPDKAVKFTGPAIKSMFSRYTAEQIDLSIRNRPNSHLYEKSGLKLYEIDSPQLSKRAEVFRARVVEKFPVIGHIVKASNRHATTFGNLMRTSLFDDWIGRNPNATAAEMKAYADIANVATGIGDLSKLGSVTRGALRRLLWSPELTVSRFQPPFQLKKYWELPRVRNEMVEMYARFVATTMATLQLIEMAWPEAKVGTDPTEADFGKVRYKDTRIDFWGGWQQPARLVAQLLLTVTDRVGITDQFIRSQSVDPVDLVSQFAEYKLSPAISLTRELITERTAVGEESDVVQAAYRNLLPLIVEDIADAYGEAGIERAALVAGLVVTGVGVATYEDSESRVRRDIKRAVRDKRWYEAYYLQERWNERHPNDQIVEDWVDRQAAE